jgi:hypothetical protein
MTGCPPRLTTVLLLAFVLGGCGVNRELARRADALVEAGRVTTTTCDRADHCAIPSPYVDIAEELRARPPGDPPAHSVTTLEHGEDALLLRVHLIRAARHSGTRSTSRASSGPRIPPAGSCSTSWSPPRAAACACACWSTSCSRSTTSNGSRASRARTSTSKSASTTRRSTKR